MSFTDGRWEGNVSFPDLQVFVDATWFNNIGGVSTIATDGAGSLYAALGNSAVGAWYANLALFLRTGVLASSYDQEQFGTAAGVAGPSSVANTSGPLALPPGFPPITAANMATIAGSINGTGAGIQRGAIPKGMQIDSVDVIYSVAGLAAVTPTVGLTKTVFANNVAPAVTNFIALGTNGLATAIQANPYVINIPVTSPAMITSADTEQTLNVNITAGATGTVKFYGAVIKAHYNFN